MKPGRVTIRIGDDEIAAERRADGSVGIGDQVHHVAPMGRGGYLVRSSDQQQVVYAAGSEQARWVFINGRTSVVEIASAASSGVKRSSSRQGALAAPMPATVRKVFVDAGASVAKGQTLILLEAMKMELALRAPRDGVVSAIRCREGELVQPDQRLIDLE